MVIALTLFACGEEFTTALPGSGGGGGGDATSSASVGGGGSGSGGNTCTPPEEIDGDCKLVVCDETGMLQSTTDNNDVFVDGDECTDDVCDGGSPSNPPSAQGSPCGNGLTCNGAGDCTGCQNDPTNCPQPPNECTFAICNGDACDFNFEPAGKRVTTQVSGDCQAFECDGNGNIIGVPDDFDVEDDNNACTDDQCSNGVPLHTNLPQNTSCGAPPLVCDGNGNCVGCIVADDCPAPGNECQTRTCTNGVCGFDPVPNGTLTPSQNPGDCLETYCDGAGGIALSPNNNDLPDDGNECTVDTCNSGAPVYTPAAANTPCSQNGGVACDKYAVCMPLDSCLGVIQSQGQTACWNHGIAAGALPYQNGNHIGLSGSVVLSGGSYVPKDPLLFPDGNGGTFFCEASDPVPNITWVHCDLGEIPSGTVIYSRVAQHDSGGAFSNSYSCYQASCVGSAELYNDGVLIGSMQGGPNPTTSGAISLTPRKENAVTNTGADLLEITLTIP
jgi:hypothetical protein